MIGTDDSPLARLDLHTCISLKNGLRGNRFPAQRVLDSTILGAGTCGIPCACSFRAQTA